MTHAQEKFLFFPPLLHHDESPIVTLINGPVNTIIRVIRISPPLFPITHRVITQMIALKGKSMCPAPLHTSTHTAPGTAGFLRTKQHYFSPQVKGTRPGVFKATNLCARHIRKQANVTAGTVASLLCFSSISQKDGCEGQKDLRHPPDLTA